MYVRPKRVPMGQLRSPLPGSSFIATHSVSGSINLTVTFSCYKNPVDCQTFEEKNQWNLEEWDHLGGEGCVDWRTDGVTRA